MIENRQKRLAIIGLGWLGMPLAEHLHHQGWQVIGTKRTLPQSPTQSPVQSATKIPIIPFELAELEHLIQLNAEQRDNPLAPLLQQEKWLITLPPNALNSNALNPNALNNTNSKAKTGVENTEKSGEPPNADYPTQIKRLVSLGISHHLKHLVFISSTGVFPATSGVFDENSPTDLTQPTAQLEQWLQQQPIDCDIVRLAGLIGQQRHPVRYLAGREHLAGANQPVNLVHQYDCIRGIECVLNSPNQQRIFHLCATLHPTREAYYRTMAKKLGFADLHFLADTQPLVRLISGEKICRELGFRYQYPDPFLMPIELFG